MYWKSGFSLVACAVLATSVSAKDRPADLGDPSATEWRRVATAADRERLRVWRDSWVAAINKARAAGHAPEIAAEGTLLQPDVALSHPMPPAGSYRCRVFKIGSRGTAARDFTSYPYNDCRIDGAEGGILRINQVNGGQRLVGRAYPDGTSRGVFLGTMLLGDEKIATKYGSDTHRNMAGIIQRVADKKWRIALPKPAFESMLDVVELVPAK